LSLLFGALLCITIIVHSEARTHTHTLMSSYCSCLFRDDSWLYCEYDC